MYNIVLQVTNLTEYHTYRSELVAWETERQRQKVEFTITDKDPYADRRIIEDPEVILIESQSHSIQVQVAATQHGQLIDLLDT